VARLHPVDTVSADELKSVLQNLCFAAGGCMKARPSRMERQRLRLALGGAVAVLKKPVCENSQVPPDGRAGGKTDPVQLVADYVASGGIWQNLIAAITSRGRSGTTRQDFLTNPARGTDHDKDRIRH